MKYPITCILGTRGSGKTLFMTGLAHRYHEKDKVKVYANFHLTKIPYEYITFSKLATLPEELYDAVVFLDEIQVGADSYEIFKKSNKAITTFATQLRKRRITLYYSTQVFTMATKRLRQQTNFIIECWPTKSNGIIDIMVFDRALPFQQQMIKQFQFDGRKFFACYDTDELIGFE
jgi:GTPase SAR1 family protein